MAKKKILILTSSEGHVSIAEAIAEKLEGTYEVILKAHRPKIFDYYLPFYQLFPGLFQIPYKLGELEAAMFFIRSFSQKNFGKIIQKFIHDANPDAVISTYYLFDEIASGECMRRHIPFFAVAADPRTFHSLTIASPSTQTLMFDERAIARAQNLLPTIQHNYVASGWFVRKRFEEPQCTKKQVQEKLGLDANVFTLLVCGGSDGSTMIFKFLPLLFQVNTPLQLVVICGNNASLYKSMKAAARLLKYSQKQPLVTMRVLGFTPNIDEYLHAADLTVGKAGPNLLFESIATQTPFFAITHISGQEDGNLELIEDKKLGFVEENPIKAAPLLASIINRPQVLKKFAAPIAAMATYNRQSKDRLLDLLAKYL